MYVCMYIMTHFSYGNGNSLRQTCGATGTSSEGVPLRLPTTELNKIPENASYKMQS